MKMSTKFTCRFCKDQFDVPKGLYKHLQLVHNAGISRDNHTCPICGVLCSKYESYRDHLLYIHGQRDDGQKLTFKSLNEFLVWKSELELKHNCKYVLQTSPKVLPTKEKKYFYQCDRSNSSKSKDKKSVSVVMKTCSSVISVVEGTGVFKVEYWDTHSGHNDMPPTQSVQTELDAAISSVEMVNAIGESDDSLDRPEAILMSDNSNPSISNVDKPLRFVKENSNNMNNSLTTNTLQKTKLTQSVLKADNTKKKSNSNVLFSLASVACGKGISKKKSANKPTENKNAEIESSSTPENSKIVSEKSNINSDSPDVKQKDDVALGEICNKDKSEESKVTSPVKTTPSGPPPIAPKLTFANNTINPLFATNSAFPNQFVLVNPSGMDQNSMNSAQNVFTGQNILFSLAPVGQNVSTSTTTQTVNQISVTEGKKTVSGSKTKVAKGAKGGSSPKVNTCNVTTVAKNSSTTQSVSNSISSVTPTITNKSNISLTPGLNNAPVILSSLPVGSTFMSVNNNLIPIASPSGSFIPNNLPSNIVLAPVVSGTSLSTVSSKTTVSSANSLPPNIVLTPIVSGTSLSSVNSSTVTSVNSVQPNIVLAPVASDTSVSTVSSSKTTASSSKTTASSSKSTVSSSKATVSSSKATVSSVNTESSAPRNIQTKVRFTAPLTVAVTVSSIVKEPIYSSSAIKHASNIVASTTSSISSTTKISKEKSQTKFVPTTLNPTLTSSPKTYSRERAQSKFIPITTAGRVSPVKDVNKSASSPKGSLNKNSNSADNKAESNSPASSSRISISLLDKSLHATPCTAPASTPVGKSSAKKRITKATKYKSAANSVEPSPDDFSSTFSTKVVNSRLHLTPISSTPNVTMSPYLNTQKPGTMIFESPAGEIYMLEPVENENSPTKSISRTEIHKIKIDRSMQTTESSGLESLKSKLQRKRPAPADDSSVMMKVKCYQLEMKFLNSQTECKRLKVELTKERLRNAELSGKKAPINVEDDILNESASSNAAQIMQDIEDRFSGNKDVNIYTMTKTSVIRSLYEDLEELCTENHELHKELENYRAHDKFYKSLKKRLHDEEF